MTDQLFETGCRLCGAAGWKPYSGGTALGELSTSRANGGAKLCHACLYESGHADPWAACDSEITRRLAAQKAAKCPHDIWNPFDGSCNLCGLSRQEQAIQKAAPSQSQGAKWEPAVPPSVPVRPAFKRCSCGQEIMRAGQYCGDCMLGSGPGDKGVKPLDARIAQAKKQLGAGIGGPRYPYAESSVIWSNPSSESDP